MSLNQLGETNISINQANTNLPAPIAGSVSLSALKVKYTGSSTSYANASVSKMSIWNLATCRSSRSPSSTVQYIAGGLNRTKDIAAPNYTGWVYNRSQLPWNPSSISEFAQAANTRPVVNCTSTPTGISNNFILTLAGSWVDPINTPRIPLGPDNTAFYFWVDGPGINFIAKRWVKSDTSNTVTFNNCINGTYTVYVQDSWGAGNQFEFSSTLIYP